VVRVLKVIFESPSPPDVLINEVEELIRKNELFMFTETFFALLLKSLRPKRNDEMVRFCIKRVVRYGINRHTTADPNMRGRDVHGDRVN
jgi:hypothetical protein